MDVRLAYITAESMDQARALAKMLIEKRLAACVNILPRVISVYEWEGAAHEAEECLLLCKTTDNKLEALTEAVVKDHSYDVPCITALPIHSGHHPFLQWVAKGVTPQD